MSELDNNEETGASLLEILDELSDRVAHAKAMPLSASVLINQSEVLDLLETARAIVPQQIVDADSVLQEASAVTNQARARATETVEEAQAHAHDIIARAQAKAEKLVTADAITVAAQAKAAEILCEARMKAAHTKQGADSYSESALKDLGEDLDAIKLHIEGLQEQVAAGRAVLAERMADAQADAANAANA